MIRGLRRGHLRIWILLALVLPALLALAVVFRRSPPLQQLPASLAPEAMTSDSAEPGTAR